MTTHQTDLSATVQRVIQIIWRRWVYLLLTTTLVLAATGFWLARQTKIYHATASIVMEHRLPQVLGKEIGDVVDNSPYAYRETADYINTQLSIACSSGVYRHVAKELALHDEPEFWALAPQAEAGHLRTEAEAAYMLPSYVRCTGRREKSSIIDISVEHSSPRLSAQIANAVAEAYLLQNIEFKVGTTSGAVKWLEGQLSTLRDELEGSEVALYEYRKQHNLVSLSLEERQNLLGQQLTMLNEQWNRSRVERLELGAQVNQLKKVVDTDVVAFPVLPEFRGTLIQKLKEKVIEERRTYAELEQRYLAKHPEVVSQSVKVGRSEDALRKELKSMIAGTQANYNRALQAERELSQMLQQAKEEAFEINKQEVDYKRLSRKAENAENIYKMVLARKAENQLSAQLRVNNARILEPAAIPALPVRPRIKARLLLGLIIGLLLSGVLIIAVEVFDNTVKGTEDVEGIADIVPLGMLPIIKLNDADKRNGIVSADAIRDLIAHHRPLSKSAEFCRAIRTNLLFASPDRVLKKILVTSPGPDEGKTTLVSNLAVTLAQREARVLIVDADLRRPKVHRVFGLSNGEGITTALRGERPIASLIRQTEVPNLFAITSGPLPPNPAELCHSERMANLLNQLAEEFDWVIVDTPPVMAVTDAVVLSRACDGTMVLARSAQTTKPALRETYRRLADVGGKMLGCVVNRVDLGKNYRYKYLYGGSAYAEGYGLSAESENHKG